MKDSAARLWIREYVWFSTDSLIRHDVLIYTEPADSTRSALGCLSVTR